MKNKNLKNLKLTNGDIILEVRPEQLIILTKAGHVIPRKNSPYYIMRFVDFLDDRIHYKFDDLNHVQETYNIRIFNCVHEGRLFQTRPEHSEEICRLIRQDRESDPDAKQKYIDLLRKCEKETPMYDILDMFLDQMEHVKKRRDGYWVHDNLFHVSLKGNVSECKDGKIQKGICVVMGDNGTGGYLPRPRNDSDEEKEVRAAKSSKSKKEDESSKSKKNILPCVKVNDLTMTIICKVFFLLRPDLTDSVFMNQLSNKAKAFLHKNEKMLAAEDRENARIAMGEPAEGGASDSIELGAAA